MTSPTNFTTTYLRYKMTPTTRPKPHNPSIVLCQIIVDVVTISLVVCTFEVSLYPKFGIQEAWVPKHH